LRIMFVICVGLLVFGAVEARADWSMAGANVERTGYVTEEITGAIHPRWYRPIEPYIPQNVQLIAWDGKIYVATARGIYCLQSDNGDLLWVYPTELPLAHSPAIVDGVLYVAGFDKCLHAVNATTGQGIWKWDGAGLGFYTTPLVVNSKVYIGSRDGNMYCIGAVGDPNEGQLVWSFPTGGPINYSAAYYDGRVYFASNDLYCYAVDAETGAQVWKSVKYQYNAGFYAIWPVVWEAKNKVVFCMDTPNYGNSYHDIEHTAIYGSLPDGYIGPTSTTELGDWAAGTTCVDMQRLVEYHQTYPWRRTVLVLDADTGEEYTWLHNGQPAYAPFGWTGAKQQSPRNAPAVGPDNVLYQNTHWRKSQTFGRGQVAGWTLGSRWLSMPNPSKHNAWDEPLAFALGGNAIYWSLCCDREWGIYRRSGSGSWQAVSYNLPSLVPGYDVMWFCVGDQDGTGNRLWGQYGSLNGIYHNATATQNPPIPHQNKLFYHRSNCVIAWDSSNAAPTKRDLAATIPVTDEYSIPTIETLKARLEAHVQAMVNAGNLRMGYYDSGQHTNKPSWGDRYEDYFSNPGETCWALLRALPYLSPGLQAQVRSYVQNWQASFPMQTYAHIGWGSGAKREEFDLPPDRANYSPALPSANPSTSSSCSYWNFPPQMFYTLWKYAQEFCETQTDVQNLLNSARSKLQVPVDSDATDTALANYAYINNAYIAGYTGYLNLQDMAGEQRNANVVNELNRLLALRVNTFSPDVPVSWTSPADNSHINRMSVYRNWEYMTPELAEYLGQQIPELVQQAIDNIDYCAPYWFVTHYMGCLQESTFQNLHDHHSVFKARAWALHQPYEELVKYLDSPAFKTGDLYYIHNLCNILDAPHMGPTIEPYDGATYVQPVTVTISLPAIPDANIYYTVDGSEPNDTDTLYTASFELSANTTVKAIAYSENGASEVTTAIFVIDTGMTNQPPVVEAGANQTITLPDNTVELAGTVDDYTLTWPITEITVSWTKVSGAGTVTFGDDQSLETSATFGKDGTYVLRLSAFEGVLSAYDDVTITVEPKPNEAPVVDAGADQRIVLPVDTVALSGSVVDDNLPNPPASVSTTWSKLSGDGAVVFDDVSQLNATAGFSSAGTYVLQLDANDGEYSASDTMTVTVYPPLLPGAVVHLKLDDAGGSVALDSSGNSNSGTVSGGAVWSTGTAGGALTFDGIDDVVTIPSTWQLDWAKGTWSVWVKTDGNWGSDGGSNGTSKGNCVVLARHNTYASREGCHIIISDAGIPIFQYKSGIAGEQLSVSATTAVTDNAWHHIAATYDQALGGPLKVYVDSVPEASSTSGYNWWFNNQDMLIGDSPDAFWEEFAGQIDDVQIYNIVLSDADIAMLYNNAGKTKKAGDINSSGAVDEVDLGLMAVQWLQTPGTPSADICPPPSGDGDVDMLDFAVLANAWLD
jgi:outer membrane protein assembly factor BamB